MKIIKACILAIGFVTGSANAADFSFTGEFKDVDEVQEFNFTVLGHASDVMLLTWSYAGGTNAAGMDIARGGFDPVVTLFNASTGSGIDENDDGSPVADSVTRSRYDSFLMTDLSAGDYTATVTQYSSFANGPSLADGFMGTGNANFGSRDSHWALDILNVNTASIGASYVSHTAPIPEPESYALLIAGLGLVAFMARRRLHEEQIS
jgi:hypothetical protein